MFGHTSTDLFQAMFVISKSKIQKRNSGVNLITGSTLCADAYVSFRLRVRKGLNDVLLDARGGKRERGGGTRESTQCYDGRRQRRRLPRSVTTFCFGGGGRSVSFGAGAADA